MAASLDRKRQIADSQFGGGATSWAPGTWWLGLSSTAPNDDGTGFTEPSGGSYGRVAILNNTTNFPAAVIAAGNLVTKANGAKFTYANPTATWGLMGWYGFFVAVSGGLPQYWNQLDAAITVRAGNTPVEFDTGALVMAW